MQLGKPLGYFRTFSLNELFWCFSHQTTNTIPQPTDKNYSHEQDTKHHQQ